MAKLLEEYQLEKDEAIDSIIERLQDNQQKYKPEGILKTSIVSIFGFTSTILSLLSVNVFTE